MRDRAHQAVLLHREQGPAENRQGHRAYRDHARQPRVQFRVQAQRDDGDRRDAPVLQGAHGAGIRRRDSQEQADVQPFRQGRAREDALQLYRRIFKTWPQCPYDAFIWRGAQLGNCHTSAGKMGNQDRESSKALGRTHSRALP